MVFTPCTSIRRTLNEWIPKMTHSHDRTLLASLAFGDPDKRDQTHDLACEFLSQPAQSERIAELVEPSAEKVVSAATEVPVSKGEGKYKTTIGFVDVLINWSGIRREGKVIVEVKIARVSVGDVVRQLNLYGEYVGFNSSEDLFSAKLAALSGAPITRSVRRVLATVYELDAGHTALLKREGICHIQLGEGFKKWFEDRSKAERPNTPQF
jgi:hypothetical protein